jgi:hypothetical protein
MFIVPEVCKESKNAILFFVKRAYKTIVRVGGDMSLTYGDLLYISFHADIVYYK